VCGIAGILAGPGRRVDPRELARVSQAIAHRGPDDQGAAGWSPDRGLSVTAECAGLPEGARVGLAHRRLSIIDTGPGGHQPMVTPDGRHALITNGEIYNYLELRRELESEGAVFASQSDTEVLLSALVRWGVERTLPRLVGMFAFAFLDIDNRRVTLARDPFGIKPLLWAMRGGDLAFASEPGALLALTGLARTVTPDALFDYLRFGVTDRGARTLFRDIHHLPAATYGVIDLACPAPPMPVTYWRPRADRSSDLSFDEVAIELGRLFRKSVGLHLRADVPVGAALSGGIDSSAVVCAMRGLEGDGLDLHTFTYVAPGSIYDEERWADIAAQAAGATMHKTSRLESGFGEALDRLIDTQGEPFGSVSVFAQNRVYAIVRDAGIKVTLDGQGADELLAGYTQFIGARLAGAVRSLDIGGILSLMCGARRHLGVGGTAARAARFLLPLGLQAAARRITGEALVPPWLDGGWFASRGVIPAPIHQPRSGAVLRGELIDSLTDKVLPALLRYQDRNAMSHSVESRVPFLTTELVDFAYSLPERYLISDGGETKSVFRAAMRGLVPDSILDRPDKIGFTIPQEKTLDGAPAWVARILERRGGGDIPALNGGGIARLLDSARKGDAATIPHLWRCALLARWAERFEVAFDA